MEQEGTEETRGTDENKVTEETEFNRGNRTEIRGK